MQNNFDMFTLKIHKIVNAVFFILFFIYAVSPLTTPLKESKKYLTEEETFKTKDVAIFFIDFLYQLGAEDDDKENSQPENENVIVKKKRAVIRKFDKATIAKAAHISHTGSVKLFAFYEQQNVEVIPIDHKTHQKALKGFLPLYSGLSPPIV